MRCNIGVDPRLLVDQHLVAESTELKMVPGMMRYRFSNKQKIGKSPDSFRLGKGHMLFFTDKLSYLSERLVKVNDEMRRRKFKPGAPDYIDPYEFGDEYSGDWLPSINDSNLIRERIAEKLLAKPPGFWRMDRDYLFDDELNGVIDSIFSSKVCIV
jgi:deoxyribonuclease (pyrimidine dimer)